MSSGWTGPEAVANRYVIPSVSLSEVFGCADVTNGREYGFFYSLCPLLLILLLQMRNSKKQLKYKFDDPAHGHLVAETMHQIANFGGAMATIANTLEAIVKTGKCPKPLKVMKRSNGTIGKHTE
jgi:hypothetical protein